MKTAPATCLKCRGTFLRIGSHFKYCVPDKTCPQCGGTFNRKDKGANFNDAKFCSIKCMSDSYRLKPGAFWEKVRKTDTCWLYEGTISFEGYGWFGHNTPEGRVQHQAHRYAWMQLGGTIPADKLLLHHCDVRNCVNPAHLYLGDRFDNARDMHRRGRWHSKYTPVEQLHWPELSARRRKDD